MDKTRDHRIDRPLSGPSDIHPMDRHDHSRTDRSHDRFGRGELSLHDVYLMQERIERMLGRIIHLMQKDLKMTGNIKAQVAELQAEMARDASVTSSAVTLIESVLAAIEENAGDEAALRELVSGYRANTDSLAAAVAKGTPGEMPASNDQPL